LARQNVWQRWPCRQQDRFGCTFLWFFLEFIPPTGGRQAKETNKNMPDLGVIKADVKPYQINRFGIPENIMIIAEAGSKVRWPAKTPGRAGLAG